MQQSDTPNTVSQPDDWQTSAQARIGALELSVQLLREDIHTLIERNRALEREIQLVARGTVVRNM